MSEKRDTASFRDEVTKKMKLDLSPSRGSASEEGIIDPPASAIVEENKPRNRDDKGFSSGSVPAASIHDQDPQTKKTGESSSSSFPTESASCSNIKERTLVYKKILARTDVSFCRLMIPLESGKEFLPSPKKHGGRYDITEISVMDHKGQLWEMEAAFDEMSSSYMVFLNWDKYVKKYELKAEDVILLYEDPSNDEHILIEFERKNDDSNPKETT